ncbi:conserved exported hypothetical protein [Candidatus Sulfopaludibacter sp. SbA4]|nr:conserved exported hypothetical protein [Candidatus Sulfopaludibacter sp. SbA4]
MSSRMRRLVPALFLIGPICFSAFSAAKKVEDLWVLKPVVRPAVPAGLTQSTNPIDAFLAAQYKAKGLRPTPPADKRVLLRRLYIDLIGIPPTPSEQDAYLADQSPDAYEKAVDKLLASEQHGVRYARHWLDVLRYADQDERMLAAAGIHYWRDWVIYAINGNMPYDQFVRAMLTGYRTNERTAISNTGYRQKLEPRPEDMYALGFLARGDVIRDNHEVHEMPITAVETVSTAFMGLTVGCAKCHDHMYDPIKQHDFYAMKALFDPLEVKKVTLATPEQILTAAKTTDETARKREPIEAAVSALIEPYKKRLYDDRVAMLPPDVKAVILKAETERTPAEMKIADDYFPVLRIDSDKILEIMPDADKEKYKALQSQLQQAGGGGRGGRGGGGLPAFWTVEINPKLAGEPSYILTSGDPDRPEKDKPVKPGWPFMPEKVDMRNGALDAFAKWLTAPENPMFARVAVNRLWQWHFGEGLQKLSSDFGTLGGAPSNAQLLDWLASEFVARGFDMKAIERLMVTSDAYRMSSEEDPALMTANNKIDPQNFYQWRFRLERLEAEPLWDAILSAAGTLDTAVGGASFSIGGAGQPRRGGRGGAQGPQSTNRRGAYMARGFSPSADVTPIFLQAFDVDDGRVPCPMRTQTVTAPQGLFMMNGEEIDSASQKLAERVMKESGGDLKAAVNLAYRITLNRPPGPSEEDLALSYLKGDPERVKNFAWLLFNLDEFLFVR